MGFTLDDSAPLIKDHGLSDGAPSDLELEVTIGEDEMFDIYQVGTVKYDCNMSN